jgi:hypothetical protein
MTSTIFYRYVLRYRHGKRGPVWQSLCASLREAKQQRAELGHGRICIERVERTPYKPNQSSCE